MRTNQGATDPLAQPPIVRTDLSTAEAAARLGFSASTVRRRIRQGVLPAAKIAGVWRITLVDAAELEPPAGPARLARGQVRSADEQATGPGAADSPAVAAQLAARREAVLQPWAASCAAQAEEIGRLRVERDHLRAEVERLGSPLATAKAQRRLAPNSDPVWHIVSDGRRAAWVIGGLVGAIILALAWWRRRST
ncbi:MAG: helix-turn-helix domain-containing protein [Chloroflexota bacterium]|nr:helix-turn-helix domain-containing protein [Chloroflexota bacterium]